MFSADIHISYFSFWSLIVALRITFSRYLYIAFNSRNFMGLPQSNPPHAATPHHELYQAPRSGVMHKSLPAKRHVLGSPQSKSKRSCTLYLFAVISRDEADRHRNQDTFHLLLEYRISKYSYKAAYTTVGALCNQLLCALIAAGLDNVVLQSIGTSTHP